MMSAVNESGAVAGLAANQVTEFFAEGYLLLPQVFGLDEVATLGEAFDRLQGEAQQLTQRGLHRGAEFVVERRGAGVRIARVVWCGAAEPVLSHFGQDPRLVAVASSLLGVDEMHQLINQAHFKLPGDGVDFPWHQDSRHRRYGTAEWRDIDGRGSYVQTLTAIDPCTPDNGPLRLIPRSHRRGHAVVEEGELPSWVDPALAKDLCMRPGDVLLMGPYTFHSSQANRSPHRRRMFINGFAHPAANTRVYPGAGAGRTVRRGECERAPASPR
ncbi:MAG: phytanoyl-CoA dioxygenase family protein [Pseudomonadota bacterium]